ncbi:hypothetical protein [Trichothermofontia sp.]
MRSRAAQVCAPAGGWVRETAASVCQLAQHHTQRDTLVRPRYGFPPTDDILEKRLTLTRELAAQEQRGEPVIGPWDPPYPQIQ